MTHQRPQDIKRAQRESFLFREIANLLLQVLRDEKELTSLSVTRAKLSPDGGLCTVFFYTQGGEKEFREKLQTLKLYKPSLRAALSKILHGRYTPELLFKYDESVDKQQKIELLFEQLKKEGKL